MCEADSPTCVAGSCPSHSPAPRGWQTEHGSEHGAAVDANSPGANEGDSGRTSTIDIYKH